MKRIKLVLAAVAAMAAMVAVAAPAMAQRELQQFDDQGYIDQNFPSPSYTEPFIDALRDLAEVYDAIGDILDVATNVREDFNRPIDQVTGQDDFGRSADEYRELLEEVAGEESQEALDDYFDTVEDLYEEANDSLEGDVDGRDRPDRDRPKGDGGGRGNGPGAGRG